MIEKKLSDYIDINPATKLEKGKCYPFVEMENIVVGIKRPRTENVLIFTGQSCSKFKPNDTLMARITPCLENGKVAKYSNGNAGFGSTEFIVFRGKSGLADDDYVYYLAKSQYIRDMAINSMTGASGRQRADAKFIGKIKWNFPSPNVQTKIASILSVYDDLIENNNKRIKILEQMAENLYKEWFVRFRFPGYETAEFENGIPKEWGIRRLDEVSKLSAGGDAPKDFSLVQSKEYPIPIYSNGMANDGLYGYCKKPTRTAKSITISARGTVGFVCLRFQPYMPIVRLVSIEPKNESVDVFYLYYYFKENSIEGYGTSQQQITIPYLSKKKILIPSIKLIEKFGIYTAKLFDKINVLKEKNQNLIKQRDLLLPRLMSGKLEV